MQIGNIGNIGSLGTSPSQAKTDANTQVDVSDTFLREARKSPVERMRAAYLKAHGLTEE